MIEQLAPEARDDFSTPDETHEFSLTGEEFELLDECLRNRIDELEVRLERKRGLRRLSPAVRDFTARELSSLRLLRAKISNQSH